MISEGGTKYEIIYLFEYQQYLVIEKSLIVKLLFIMKMNILHMAGV